MCYVVPAGKFKLFPQGYEVFRVYADCIPPVRYSGGKSNFSPGVMRYSGDMLIVYSTVQRGESQNFFSGGMRYSVNMLIVYPQYGTAGEIKTFPTEVWGIPGIYCIPQAPVSSDI